MIIKKAKVTLTINDNKIALNDDQSCTSFIKKNKHFIKKQLTIYTYIWLYINEYV